MVDDITRAGGTAIANYEDIADWNGARRTIEQAYDTWGRLDILVNNAGVLRDRMSFNMSEDEFDLVHEGALQGALRHDPPRLRALARGRQAVGARVTGASSTPRRKPA